MEDVLAVYTRPRDGDCPLVCLDETSKQLIAETRVPISMKTGRPARFDYEYERNGTANLFMMFAPLEGWRHVKVTDRHTAVDYARALKDLADIHFAHAKTIVLVQDNLSIHSKACMGHFLSRSGCAAFRISCQGVVALLFAFLGRLILWFDPRCRILPSRPHVSLAVARSGGKGWPPPTTATRWACP